MEQSEQSEEPRPQGSNEGGWEEKHLNLAAELGVEPRTGRTGRACSVLEIIAASSKRL